MLGGALLTALLSVTAAEDAGRLPAGEFWFLLLSSAAGAALLPASRDLATLVVALEVASLPAFALVGMRARRPALLRGRPEVLPLLRHRHRRQPARRQLRLRRHRHPAPHRDRRPPRSTSTGQLDTLAQAGVVLTLVGFAFKTAAVPFHFWVPDTYVGAPLPIAAYLSVVGKAVGFSGLILVTVVAFPSYADVWGPALAVLAALTMTVGNVAALRQRPTRAYSAVRLLAWSSVGQAGYLLVPIAAAAYSERRRAGHRLHRRVRPHVRRREPRRLRRRRPRRPHASRSTASPTTAACTPRARSPPSRLGFFLLCLAGLPPGIIGLFAKVTVFSAAVDAGLGWLAVVMAVNVVIALYYYLQWTALLFRAPRGRSPRAPRPGTADGRASPSPPSSAVALSGAPSSSCAPRHRLCPSAPQLVLRSARHRARRTASAVHPDGPRAPAARTRELVPLAWR